MWSDVTRFGDCFCLHHQGVEGTKRRYVYVYLKKKTVEATMKNEFFWNMARRLFQDYYQRFGLSWKWRQDISKRPYWFSSRHEVISQKRSEKLSNYLTWRVAKCNKVKWSERSKSEVEWGEVKCSIGKLRGDESLWKRFVGAVSERSEGLGWKREWISDWKKKQ